MELSPKIIITDFLRSRVTDPRGRNADSNIETFTATAGQTEFILTAPSGSVDFVSKVEINNTEIKKWRDYAYDYRLEKIILFTASTLADEVKVTYNHGISWIYDDKPYVSLSSQSFPRISISVLSSPTTRLGNYEAPVESSIQMQIDIWVKEKQDGQVFEMDGKKWSGERLAELIGYSITNAFEDYEEDLFPVLYGFSASSYPIDLPYDEDLQVHHKSLTIEIRGINIGRIEV